MLPILNLRKKRQLSQIKEPMSIKIGLSKKYYGQNLAMSVEIKNEYRMVKSILKNCP